MNKKTSVLDDMGKMASSLFANLVNVKNEVRDMVAEQIKSSLKQLDFVHKKEFDALKKKVAMLEKERKK